MMNQINSTKAVVTAVIFSISLLGMITRAEAHLIRIFMPKKRGQIYFFRYISIAYI